jgi:hypothetical protein
MIIRHLENPYDKERIGKCNSSIKRFKIDMRGGVDANVVEYPYLLDLMGVVITADLSREIGYESIEDLWDDSKCINNIRNKVAHPNKSLISKPDGVNKLWWNAIQMEERLTDELEAQMTKR